MSDREELAGDLRNRAQLLLQSARRLLNAHPETAETAEGVDLAHNATAFTEAWRALIDHALVANEPGEPPPEAVTAEPEPPAQGFHISS